MSPIERTLLLAKHLEANAAPLLSSMSAALFEHLVQSLEQTPNQSAAPAASLTLTPEHLVTLMTALTSDAAETTMMEAQEKMRHALFAGRRKTGPVRCEQCLVNVERDEAALLFDGTVACGDCAFEARAAGEGTL